MIRREGGNTVTMGDCRGEGVGMWDNFVIGRDTDGCVGNVGM